LALVVSNGLTIGGIPVFYKPMSNSLVETGAVAVQQAPQVVGNAASLTILLAGLFAFVVGWLIQRFSLRALMCVGAVLLGSTLVFYSRATQPIHVYISHTMFGLTLGFVGVMVNTILVSRWFKRRRGTALGILLTGTSIGGVLIPRIANPFIISYGWRTAMIVVSLLIWIVLLPAIIFLVREKPEDMGLTPDGELLTEDTATDAPTPGMTLGEALSSPLFWVFSICAACLFYPIFVTSQQFILYLQTPRIGMSQTTASYAQSGLFACSLGGKFLFGWLSDRLPPTRVFLGCCLLMFAATLVLFNLNSGTAFFFLLPFGLGYGGTFVLLQLLSVEYFGLKEAGKIIGAVTIIETIGASFGTALTGKLAAAAGGDYTTAFYGVIIATSLALIMTVMVNLIYKPKISKVTGSM
jgi:sugar phosphate permease